MTETTTTPLTTTYTCADGRDFPVTWPDAEAAKQLYFWDPEHNANAVTPLDHVMWMGCVTGTSRAAAEVGFAPTDVFIGGSSFKFFNGFMFFSPIEAADEVKKQREAANDRLRAEYGSSVAHWERWGEPRSKAAIQKLREATADEPIAGLLEIFGYGFEQTFLMFGIDKDDLDGFLKEEGIEDHGRVASDLTKGYRSATLDADQALWELAQPARRSPALRAALTADGEPSLEVVARVEGGADFVQAFQRYLDYYGWRSIGWDISGPTIRERPEASLRVVRRTVVEDLEAPAARTAAAAAQRDALAAEYEARFAHDPAKLDEFGSRLARQAGYIGLREGRALWQLSLSGALRHALLLKGRRLVETAVIDADDDVFYLLPEEIEARPPASDLRHLVTQRRAEHDRWAGAIPPGRIGGEGADASGGAEASGSEPSWPEDSQVPQDAAPPGGRKELKGTAASHGVATGRARVLSSFEEYDRLAPGEILVCSTTTPAWTPLFAVAAALVTDGGGLLSHPAIAAREYGIPAVVGARAATQTIPDGAMVTVDGTAGIVRIEG